MTMRGSRSTLPAPGRARHGRRPSVVRIGAAAALMAIAMVPAAAGADPSAASPASTVAPPAGTAVSPAAAATRPGATATSSASPPAAPLAATASPTTPVAAPAPAAEADPKAVAVAERVIEALGGEAAWKGTRHLRFDFAVDREGRTVMSRAHTWDKWTGRYRVEAKNEKGQTVVVLMNLNDKQGRAFVDGKPAEGDALAKLLESGYAWWVNDAYWLLMPYKMRDPGVTLSWVREEKGEGGPHDVVLLTFEGVGLTPKDKYWVFVNKATGLVDRWEFVLKGEKAEPTPFLWKGWKTYGGIRLADDRVNPKDGTRIHFPVLDVPATVTDATFTSP